MVYFDFTSRSEVTARLAPETSRGLLSEACCSLVPSVATSSGSGTPRPSEAAYASLGARLAPGPS